MSATLATPRLRAYLTMDDGHERGVGRRGLPLFLTVDEAAEQHPRGGWDVDINVLLATGDRDRERRKLNAS